MNYTAKKTTGWRGHPIHTIAGLQARVPGWLVHVADRHRAAQYELRRYDAYLGYPTVVIWLRRSQIDNRWVGGRRVPVWSPWEVVHETAIPKFPAQRMADALIAAIRLDRKEAERAAA